jgi:plastocyanin
MEMRRWPLVCALLALLLAVFASPATAATHTKSFTYPVSVDPFGVKQDVTFDVDHPRVDGFITRMSADVVDADGKQVPINRIMLHHIVFQKLGVKSSTCDTFTLFDGKTTLPAGADSFMFAGEERNEMVLPPGYGYPIAKDDKWSMVWMLMNHRPQPDPVFIRWTVTYEDSEQLTPVRPIWLDVVNCNADPVYTVAGSSKPKIHERRYERSVPESGRVVAVGGHVHGGANDLRVSQVDCDDRVIHRSRPAWGTPDHPFYKVRPILHEPGPLSMSRFVSGQGWPISKGQKLALTSRYDNTLPHTRVMGIVIAYLAPDASVPEGCAPPPGDVQVEQPAELAGTPFRSKTPKFVVPLTGTDEKGRAITISRPPGKTRDLKSGSTIKVGDFEFSTANARVTRGAKLNWKFGPTTLHNVTLANGPRGFSSLNLNDGRVYGYKFKVPGTYRVFCGLHPVSMTQTVTVR